MSDEAAALLSNRREELLAIVGTLTVVTVSK